MPPVRGEPGLATGPGGEPPTATVSVHALLNQIFLVLILLGFVALLALEVTPAGTVRVPLLGRELPPTCAYVLRTGRPCPSCGVTRSLVLAAEGEFGRSREFHPAGVLLLTMLLAQCLMRLAFLWPGLRIAALDLAVSAGMAVAVAWLLN